MGTELFLGHKIRFRAHVPNFQRPEIYILMVSSSLERIVVEGQEVSSLDIAVAANGCLQLMYTITITIEAIK